MMEDRLRCVIYTPMFILPSICHTTFVDVIEAYFLRTVSPYWACEGNTNEQNREDEVDPHRSDVEKRERLV